MYQHRHNSKSNFQESYRSGLHHKSRTLLCIYTCGPSKDGNILPLTMNIDFELSQPIVTQEISHTTLCFYLGALKGLKPADSDNDYYRAHHFITCMADQFQRHLFGNCVIIHCGPVRIQQKEGAVT
jgi:hypothetical protein